MPSILGANEIKATGYDVANSVRFNSADSPTLKDSDGNNAPAGNRQKFTFSIWFKRSKLGVTQMLASSAYSSGDEGYLYISGGDVLVWHHSSSGMGQMITTQKFMDVSAWYHLVWAVDTTQGTASNRMKFYINGTQITSFGTETYPDQNKEIYWNVGGTYYPYIGRRHGGDYWDGYLAEVVHIDNSQLAADSFGEFDEDSGIWKPIDVSDLTFGTSGYYLDFEDSSDLGKDVSGVGNHFASTNLAATDQSTDTCTNNFATLSPLRTGIHTLTEGNLEYTAASSAWKGVFSTIGVSTGKWYCEVKYSSLDGSTFRFYTGIADARDFNTVHKVGQNESGRVGDTIGFLPDAASPDVLKNGSDAGGSWSTMSVNDILGMAIDCDNGALYFSKNGTWENSSDPESGASKTGAITFTVGETYLFGFGTYGDSSPQQQVNFGNPIHSISSGNTDGDGYGNFEYAVPSGYFSINTKNLAEYG